MARTPQQRMEAKAGRCKRWVGRLDMTTLLPINAKGEFVLFGYRLCGINECVNPLHVTSSIRQARGMGLRPRPLKHFRHDITGEQLAKLAKPMEKGAPRPSSCLVSHCPRAIRTLHLCNGHYTKLMLWRREKFGKLPRVGVDKSEAVAAALPFIGANDFRPKDRFCHVANCENPYQARGLCKKHHGRFLAAKAQANASR